MNMPSRRARDVAAHDVHAELAPLFAKARVQLVDELDLQAAGKAEGHEGEAGNAAGGGDVAQVDRQGLAAEAARGDRLAQEMGPLHLHVAGGEPHASPRQASSTATSSPMPTSTSGPGAGSAARILSMSPNSPS